LIHAIDVIRRLRSLTSLASAILFAFRTPLAAEAGFFPGRFMARLKAHPSRALRGAEEALFHGGAWLWGWAQRKLVLGWMIDVSEQLHSLEINDRGFDERNGDVTPSYSGFFPSARTTCMRLVLPAQVLSISFHA
jgi:hypothetical protein